MTQEEKYQFILDNDVEISINRMRFTCPDGEEYKPKYYVAINGIGYCGYDLDEAIELHKANF